MKDEKKLKKLRRKVRRLEFKNAKSIFKMDLCVLIILTDGSVVVPSNYKYFKYYYNLHDKTNEIDHIVYREKLPEAQQ